MHEMAIRRVIKFLPHPQFRVGKAVEVRMPGKLDRLRLRRERLHDDLARAVATAGAARHLHEQLESPLVRAKIRHVHRQVGVDESDQRHVGKVEALADHLRADEHVDLAGAKVIQDLAEPVLLRHRVRIDPLEARAWQYASHRLLDALRAEPAPADVGRRAFRAHHRSAAFVSAQMALQRLVGAVVGERHAAMRALLHVAAFAAQHARGIAAPVDEENRLLLSLESLVHVVDEQARQGDESALPHELDAHVDDLNVRHLLVVDAAQQQVDPVFARADVGDGLERRRRRAEQANGVGQLRAIDGDIAPMIARRLVLLVGGLVLFIDDDQPQIVHRCEHRRARANHHPRLARRQRLPAVEPLALAEVAVPDDRAMPGRLEPPAQARHRLRRERHLRHEVDRAAARGEHLLHGPQVDFRFPRAGDAVQQVHREFPARQTLVHGLHGDGLLLVQFRRQTGNDLAVAETVGVGDAFDVTDFLVHEGALDQRADDRGGAAEAREHEGFFHRPKLLLKKLAELRLLRRARTERRQFGRQERARECQIFFLLHLGVAAHRGRDHRLEHLLHARRIVGMDPTGQRQQVGRQRRERVQRGRHELQFFGRAVGDGVELDDDAELLPVEDGHPDEAAHAQSGAQRLRHAVVQELVEARHRLDTHDHRVM